jgi:hypothetical protein
MWLQPLALRRIDRVLELRNQLFAEQRRSARLKGRRS